MKPIIHYLLRLWKIDFRGSDLSELLRLSMRYERVCAFPAQTVREHGGSRHPLIARRFYRACEITIQICLNRNRLA